MNKEDLLIEAKNAYKGYLAECVDNFNHEGTPTSMMLLAKVEIIAELLKKYFNTEYTFKRMI
jgi:ribosome-associated toxin RatA of RatAB toxin-antitoxin module